MRFVIFGAGAIGGLVGANLHRSGHDVALIARGAHYEKIAADGLTVATPSERVTLQIPVAPTVAGLGLRADDVVLLCTKSQHSTGALLAIRDAAIGAHVRVPVVCMQNGVESERLALRLFAEVYAGLVMIPAEHLEPGYIVGYGSRLSGEIDIGRYPHGGDQRAAQISEAFLASRFHSQVREDIIRHKYAKLINNLGNGVHAICGSGDTESARDLLDRVRHEGRAVLRAAGIDHTADNVTNVDERWRQIGAGEVDGHRHRGGSTWQSITRATGNVETDYFNGEIVLLGRQLELPTPYNELIQRLTQETVVGGHQPGWRSPLELIAEAEAAR